MDLHFRNAFAYGFALSEVAWSCGINPMKNMSFGLSQLAIDQILQGFGRCYSEQCIQLDACVHRDKAPEKAESPRILWALLSLNR
jgi:hypothetical protein